MIVQSAPTGGKHFVITMDQHTALSAQFAEEFGNDDFESVEPRDLMLHVIANHDVGWRDLDATALRDPKTGLPYNLVETPFSRIVETSSASPNANGAHHPFCELISSMHSWGLYNGRYGMSDKMLLDTLAAENRSIADTMLDGEAARQVQLKETLGTDPDTAAWIEDEHLLQNYKQLQFFDTLALYFNCVHEDARGESTFIHIPRNGAEDTEVNIEPVADGVYALDPFPFRQDDIQVTFDGRYMAAVSEGDNVRAVLEKAPVETQSARLVHSEKNH